MSDVFFGELFCRISHSYPTTHHVSVTHIKGLNRGGSSRDGGGGEVDTFPKQ